MRTRLSESQDGSILSSRLTLLTVPIISKGVHSAYDAKQAMTFVVVKNFLATHSPDSLSAFARLGSCPLPGLWIIDNAGDGAVDAAFDAVTNCGWNGRKVRDAGELVDLLMPENGARRRRSKPTIKDDGKLDTARPTLLLIAAEGALLGARCAPAAALLRAALERRIVLAVVTCAHSPPASLALLFETQRATRREVTPREEDVRGADWDHLGGLGTAKKRLRVALEWPRRHGTTLTRLGVRASRGVLLHGPPGCGKTSLVRAVAAAGGASFVSLSAADVFSCYLGEAERIIRDVFAEARRTAPCMIFLDEIDAIAGDRAHANSGGGAGVGARVLATLLTEMDGVITAPAAVVVVAATNRVDAVDNALLRPGRFDDIVYVPLPDESAREAIARIWCAAGAPVGDIDFADIASRAEGMSGAQVSGVCKEAALCAAREAWAVIEETAEIRVEQRHFNSAFSASS